MTRETYQDRQSWLKARTGSIGASEASIITGHNRWKSIDRLYDEKAGIVPVKEETTAVMQVGIDSEDPIRRLMAIEFPWLEVRHYPYDILRSDTHPYITATLDGELWRDGKWEGILEVKRTSFLNEKDFWSAWNPIPDYYLDQAYQQLFVTEVPKYVLFAVRAVERNPQGLPKVFTVYRIVARDKSVHKIEDLVRREEKFWTDMKQGIRPPTLLRMKYGQY